MAFVFCSIALTTCSQLLVKWRVSRAGSLPVELTKKVIFLTGLLLDPWIIVGIVATFFAGLTWMAAMTRLELSLAYPFVSLSFVLVFLFSAILFHETVTTPKVIGMLLIVAGIIVTARG